MLTRNQKTSPGTGADFALPGMVATHSQSSVYVAIKHPVATLKWLTREQRERE